MVEWKKLGEVCVIKNGYTPSTKENSYWENGTLPWFTLEDIRKNGRILEDAIKHITSLGVKKGGLFPKDSIIVSTTATIGEYALIKSDFLCNQQITCLTIKTDLKEQLLPKYLYYLSDRIGKWCKKNVNGGGSLLIVSTSKLNNFLIPIPSIEEQNRIVGILDTFTASIDNLKEQIAQRRKQYEYYRDQLLDLEGKEGVEMKTMGELCNFIRGPFGGALKKEIFVSDGYAIYEQQHAIYGEWSFRYFIDEKKFNQMKRFEVHAGDILMSCSGTMGKTSIIPENYKEGIINQALLKLSTKDEISNKFLKLFMDSLLFQDALKGKTAGGAIQNVASVSVLKNIHIPVPSLQDQQRIVSILDTFEASIQNLEAQLSQREKQYEYYRNKLLTFE